MIQQTVVYQSIKLSLLLSNKNEKNVITTHTPSPLPSFPSLPPLPFSSPPPPSLALTLPCPPPPLPPLPPPQGLIDKTRSIFWSKSMSLSQSSYKVIKLTVNGIATKIHIWMICHQSNTVTGKSIMWDIHDWDPGDNNVIHSRLSVF